MKKPALISALALLCAALATAEIGKSGYKVTESKKEFDIEYVKTKDMKEIKPLKNGDVDVTKAYSVEMGGIKGELRYSLFTEVSEDPNQLMSQYAMQVLLCMLNATGVDVDLSEAEPFEPADVAKDFNGDFGCTAFFQNPKSEFAKGYKYMSIDFFGKQGQGLVMRTFLFNDIRFILNEDGSFNDDSLYSRNYYSFRFMEKNEKGKFVPSKAATVR